MREKETNQIIVVCGPTAVGKTGFGIDLARAVGGEIVGADSMQIYRHMDIGTAKPSAEERAQVRHHLVDFCDPAEPFDAAAYTRLARETIERLLENSVVPLVVGGTGLYIKGLLGGLFPASAASRPVRNRLRQEAERRGTPDLHRRLAQRDPETAARLHPNDTFRVVRALEVLVATGEPISRHQQRHRFGDAPYRALKLGVFLEREALYRRIDRRCEAMLQAGLIDEVERLLAMGYSPQLKAMQSIGYRHVVDYLAGRTNREETLRLFCRDTRRYAKRQLTWFRADPEICWLAPDAHEEAADAARRFLKG
ncbi:MAG: tRNA (adenosine(37)-N6)-dimethylallyltransferase MiaA [Desulfobacterales bacterium]|jgi:tRNA dimethylallyltransferase